MNVCGVCVCVRIHRGRESWERNRDGTLEVNSTCKEGRMDGWMKIENFIIIIIVSLPCFFICTSIIVSIFLSLFLILSFVALFFIYFGVYDLNNGECEAE